MSIEESAKVMSATQSIKKEAAHWLQRADGANWNVHDQNEFDAWLSQSAAHRLAYWRVKSAWERAQRLRILQPAREEIGARGPARRLRSLHAGAAALAVIAFVAAGFALLSLPREQTFSTGLGGHRVIALADGTRVELNTDTRLRVKINARERDIALDKGEAFFQITHDSARPLIVTAGNRRVVDLGTKFLVRRDSDHFEVALVEGRARFEATDGAIKQPVVLMPGDTIVGDGRAISFKRKTPERLADEMGWRRGVLVFSHVTLADAADEFNRYNARKIVIADSSAARMAIGGTFDKNNAESFAQLVHNLLGLRVDKRGDEIVISR
ncbi:MAG TPA: FecR domain-containing protein [Rhizomicrobium sp.]|jgi:transmembrane sensor|nr:FecR domain-containing protein [Rhizomicrobium sp.]